MDIIVDKEAGRVYVRLLDDPIKTVPTHYLDKHGATLHWDGHGTLMGVEFKLGLEDVIIVKEAAGMTQNDTEEFGGRIMGSLSPPISITCSQHGVANCPCLSAPAGGDPRWFSARPPIRSLRVSLRAASQRSLRSGCSLSYFLLRLCPFLLRLYFPYFASSFSLASSSAVIASLSGRGGR